MKGFVVDGGPIVDWFDPRFLKEIDLVDLCFDAYFTLHETDFAHVRVSCPLSHKSGMVVPTVVRAEDMESVAVHDRKVVVEEFPRPASRRLEG